MRRGTPTPPLQPPINLAKQPSCFPKPYTTTGAAGSPDGPATSWLRREAAESPTTTALPPPAAGLALSADGRWLVVHTASDATLWELGSAADAGVPPLQPTSSFPNAAWGNAAGRFGRGEQQVASGDKADRTGGAPSPPAPQLRHKLECPDGGVAAVAVAADGSAVAVGGGGGLLRVWSADGDRSVELAGHGAAGGATATICSVSLSSGGERLASATASTVFLWTRRRPADPTVPRATLAVYKLSEPKPAAAPEPEGPLEVALLRPPGQGFGMAIGDHAEVVKLNQLSDGVSPGSPSRST